MTSPLMRCIKHHWAGLVILAYAILALICLWLLRQVLPIPGGDLF